MPSFEYNMTDVNLSRTKVNDSYVWNGSCNAGRLVPFCIKEVLPGQNTKIGFSGVIRMTTPVGPTMDDLYCDLMYFYVKNKDLLSRQTMSPSVNDSNHSWAAIMGAQDSLLNMPYPDNELHIPKFANMTSTVLPQKVGGLLDCMGLSYIPESTQSDRKVLRVDCLPVLSYIKVWNDYFREPNLQEPVTFSVENGLCVLQNIPGYTSALGTNNLVAIDCFPVSRKRTNYFASALPFPQRNASAVELPLTGDAPVMFDRSTYFSGSLDIVESTRHAKQLAVEQLGTEHPVYADMSDVSAATVNDLRYSFALQRYYEALARSGNSYGQLKYVEYGVKSRDLVDGQAEFLGKKTVMINISQVNGTSDNLGQVGAFSLTGADAYIGTKGFDDFGFIVGVLCIRPRESFYQGIDKMWTRDNKFGYWTKQFANIGEVPVLNKEIFFTGTDVDDDVFGYQEYGYEYRSSRDVVSGVCKPNNLSYGYWTYANNFASTPTLKGYLDGANLVDNVDQTLKVRSSVAGHQFIMQIANHLESVKPITANSIPGYVDHN